MARQQDLLDQGFATEAAFALMQLGFDRFALSRLVAIIQPDNRPSRRVARKLGMVEERTLVHDGEPVVVYATPGQRQRWRSSCSTASP